MTLQYLLSHAIGIMIQNMFAVSPDLNFKRKKVDVKPSDESQN